MGNVQEQDIRKALATPQISPSPELLARTRARMAAVPRRDRAAMWTYIMAGALALLEIAALLVMPYAKWALLFSALDGLLGIPAWTGYGILFFAWTWVVVLCSVVPLSAWLARTTRVTAVQPIERKG